MATYYMRADGTAVSKEAATGDGDASTFMSGSRHNTEASGFSAGDTIIVNEDGGDFYTTLNVAASGSSGNRITYEAASGDSPVFNGSNLVTGWTTVGGAPASIDTLSSPASGSTYTADADGSITVVFTYETTNYVKVYFRGTTIGDSIQLIVGTGGDLTLNKVVSGTPTELDTSASVFSDGVEYTVEITYDGTALAVLVDDTPTLSATESQWQAVEDGKIQHTLDSNDIELESFDTGSITENMYQASVSVDPKHVFIDDNFGDVQTSVVNCVNLYDWYWNDADDLLYLYDSSGNPDSRSSPGVERGHRSYGCDLQNSSYVDFDGITFKKAKYSGWYEDAAPSYITMSNCIFEWNFVHGWDFGGSATLHQGIIVEDCIARYNGGFGLKAARNHSGTIIRRNECYNNGTYQRGHDEHAWTGGMGFWGDEDYIVGMEIYENVSYDNGYEVDDGSLGVGIWMDTPNSTGDPSLIYHNRVYGNNSYGIYLEKALYQYCFNNVVYDNAYATNSANIGLRSGTAGQLCTNNRVYGNTVVDSQQHGIAVQSFHPGNGQNMNNNEVKNNIVIGSIGNDLKCNNGGDNDTTNGTGNLYSNNCFGAAATDFLYWNGAAYSTYDLWLAATPTDGKSDDNVESDPSFTAAGSDDYTLASDSPCIGAGANLGADYDDALMPSSTWPDGVVTGDQDDY